MDAAAPPAAAGQRDVERFFRKARRKLGVGEFGAARIERFLDALLGGVVRGACGALLLGGIPRRAETGKLPALAEEARLRVLQGRGVAGRAECGKRAVDDAR